MEAQKARNPDPQDSPGGTVARVIRENIMKWLMDTPKSQHDSAFTIQGVLYFLTEASLALL